MFFNIDYMLGHKTGVIILKMIKIIQTMFFDHNGMKPEITKKENLETHTHVKIKPHTPQIANGSKEKHQRELNYFEKRMKTCHTKTC